jgi:hypothetical protein
MSFDTNSYEQTDREACLLTLIAMSRLIEKMTGFSISLLISISFKRQASLSVYSYLLMSKDKLLYQSAHSY